MFDFWPIYKRELKAYFQSPSTYVVLALFFLIVGIFFQEMMAGFSMASARAAQPSMYGQAPPAPNVTEFVIRNLFQLMNFLLLFIIPMLSMRLIAEEKSRGTFELLVTCPIGDWSVLLGKYFAMLTIGLGIVLLSAIFPVIVWWAGQTNQSAPEWPVVFSCWVGLFMIFATYGAFGLMASSLTESQITAAVITFIGILLWLLLGSLQMESMPKVRDILQELTASQHLENLIKGVLVVKDFMFYILASFLFLFIASKTLDARRWRV